MKIIGLTGGIGSGKSTVLRLLEEHFHCYTIQLDEVAHELTKPGNVCYDPVRALFGDEILAENGEIDRKKLAGIVFSDKEKLDKLNWIVHPAVKQEILARISEQKGKNRYPAFVMEAALLIEDHYDEICDEIWYVYADPETRIRRLMDSRGYSREKALAVMENQMPDAEYRKHYQRIIDNSGELCYTDLRFL